jgi:hypothetical protein
VGVLWLACLKRPSGNTYSPTKVSDFVVLANIFRVFSITATCDVMLSRLTENIQCYKVTRCIPLQGRRSSEISENFYHISWHHIQDIHTSNVQLTSLAVVTLLHLTLKKSRNFSVGNTSLCL